MLLVIVLYVDSGIVMRNGDEDDMCGIGGWYSWYFKFCLEVYEGMCLLVFYRNLYKIKVYYF